MALVRFTRSTNHDRMTSWASVVISHLLWSITRKAELYAARSICFEWLCGFEWWVSLIHVVLSWFLRWRWMMILVESMTLKSGAVAPLSVKKLLLVAHQLVHNHHSLVAVRFPSWSPCFQFNQFRWSMCRPVNQRCFTNSCCLLRSLANC